MDDDKEADIPFPTLGNTLTKAANSGPVKALFTPAAKAFGDYLGWRVNEITERWKQQREKNLERHAAKVQETDGAPIPREPTEKQVILVREWIERAQEVDPDDPEIAALWQSLLGAIYRKEADAKDWLEIIKQLNESDARFLMRISRSFEPKNSREKAQANKLVSLGLLESFNLSRVLHGLPLAVLVFVALCIFGLLIMSDQVFEKFVGWDWLLFKSLSLVLLATALVTIALSFLLEVNRYHVTDLGRDIRRSALRYLDKKPDVAKRELKEAEPTVETTREPEQAHDEKKSKRGRRKVAETG